MSSLLKLAPLILAISACGSAAPRPAIAAPEEGTPPLVVSLRFEEQETDEDEAPETEVTLVLIAHTGLREETPLGIFEGACTHQRPTEGELVRAQCWWGPNTETLILRRERLELVVRREDDEVLARRAVDPEAEIRPLPEF